MDKRMIEVRVKHPSTMQLTSETSDELRRAHATIDAAGTLSDWINRARPVITELMEAYARLVRSHSGMGAMELPEMQPWRCAEYLGAEDLLRDQPVAVVEISQCEPFVPIGPDWKPGTPEKAPRERTSFERFVDDELPLEER